MKRRAWLSRLLVETLLPVTMGACGAGQRSTHPASVSPYTLAQASVRIEAVLLTAAQLPGSWATMDDRRAYRNATRLQDACGAKLGTDRQILTAEGDLWSNAGGHLPYVDEMVYAYTAPVAAHAVGEAARATTCRTYSSEAGAVRVTGTYPAPSGVAGRFFGYCEKLQGAHGDIFRCAAMIGSADLVCSVRAWAADQAATIELLDSLIPLVDRSCR